MHLIAIRNLRVDAAKYPDVQKSIDSWYATLKKARWQNLEDVRIVYRDATVYYKYFLTHADC